MPDQRGWVVSYGKLRYRNDQILKYLNATDSTDPVLTALRYSMARVRPELQLSTCTIKTSSSPRWPQLVYRNDRVRPASALIRTDSKVTRTSANAGLARPTSYGFTGNNRRSPQARTNLTSSYDHV